MLTATATTTDVPLFGNRSAASVPTPTIHAQNMDLRELTRSLTTMSATQDTEDSATLVDQGLQAATFVASGAHTNYAGLTVDNSGRNAIQWLTDWFALHIQHAT
jgi:hypothetical protein